MKCVRFYVLGLFISFCLSDIYASRYVNVEQHSGKSGTVTKKIQKTKVIIKPHDKCGIYLGISDSNTKSFNMCYFRFYVDGKINKYNIADIPKGRLRYTLHSQLQEGFYYRLTVRNNVVIDLVPLELTQNYVDGRIEKITSSYVCISGNKYSFNKHIFKGRIIKRAGGAIILNYTPQKGHTVKCLLKNNRITHLFVSTIYHSVEQHVYAIPGKSTLKNYLATALSGVGRVLYIFGGGWSFISHKHCDFPLTTTIGIPRSCEEFFCSQTANFSYKLRRNINGKFEKDTKYTYYPYHSYRLYNYAGMDCSAYIAWIMYNVKNTTNHNKAYNLGSLYIASTYAKWKWGRFTRKIKKPRTNRNSYFKPGAIMSIKGHVWLCIGTCKDGSIVIVHSCPTPSITGCDGGGIQLSAIGNSTNCEAYKLANHYMRRYCKEWSKRYTVSLKKYSDYINVKHRKAGLFQWNYKNRNGLTDPDGYRNMSPAKILSNLFQD